MKTFDELTEKEKERQLCYETSRSRLENIINSDIITLFIFLAVIMTLVFSVFGYGVTTVVTAESMEDGTFSLGVTMLEAAIMSGIVGMFFFLILFSITIYKRDQFRKELFAIYEMDENIYNVSKTDLRKIKRTWKKEDN